ncbi:protein of unknown function [Lactiplantibacillus plantarum]
MWRLNAVLYLISISNATSSIVCSGIFTPPLHNLLMNKFIHSVIIGVLIRIAQLNSNIQLESGEFKESLNHCWQGNPEPSATCLKEL